MSVIACILFNMVVFLNGSYCLQYYVGIQEKAILKCSSPTHHTFGVCWGGVVQTLTHPLLNTCKNYAHFVFILQRF